MAGPQGPSRCQRPCRAAGRRRGRRRAPRLGSPAPSPDFHRRARGRPDPAPPRPAPGLRPGPKSGEGRGGRGAGRVGRRPAGHVGSSRARRGVPGPGEDPPRPAPLRPLRLPERYARPPLPRTTRFPSFYAVREKRQERKVAILDLICSFVRNIFIIQCRNFYHRGRPHCIPLGQSFYLFVYLFYYAARTNTRGH